MASKMEQSTQLADRPSLTTQPLNRNNKPSCSFMTLPTELKLEILRQAIIANPPHIDWQGNLCGTILSDELVQIRDEVLDVRFHTVPLRIPFSWIHSSRPLREAEFLKVHDQVHGKDKRGRMKLQVIDRPFTTRKEEILLMDRKWRMFEAVEGIPIEIEDEGTWMCLMRRADGRSRIVRTPNITLRKFAD